MLKQNKKAIFLVCELVHESCKPERSLRHFWSPGSLVLLFGTCWIAQYRCWVPGEGQAYKERVYQEKVWSLSFVYIKIQSEANLALISETYGLLNSLKYVLARVVVANTWKGFSSLLKVIFDLYVQLFDTNFC